MKLEDLKRLAQRFPYPPTQSAYARLQDYLVELGLDPDNLYQELEMSDPFAQVHQDSSYSNQMLSLHSHSFYEILCCRNTCGAEYLVGAERYRLQKGDIIFVPPGTSHRPLLPVKMEEPYIRDVLWISGEFVQELRHRFDRQETRENSHSYLLRTAGTQWEYLSGMLRQVVEEAERREEGWRIAVAGEAMTFMAHLKRAFLAQDTVPIMAEKPGVLDRVVAHVEEHLADRITLAETAQRFYVSESTIRQAFRKTMGVSFYRYVTQRRLITAKQLISEGRGLETVAARTGFSDYSVFYRAFKQEYGISPRQYRALQEGAGLMLR